MSGVRDGRAAVFAALLAVQAIFGVHYLVAKLLLSEIEPRAWALLRIVAAAAILVGVALASRRPFPRRAGDWGRLALFSVFGVVVNQICFVEGLSRTTPTHSAIINTTIPVSTLLFAVLLGRERLSGAKALAWGLAFAGVMLVIRPWQPAAGEATVLGDVLCLINATSFAFFLVISRRLLTRTDPLAATAALFAIGSLGIALVGWRPLWEFSPRAVSSSFWPLAAFAIVFATAGTYLLNYWALARVDSSVVALFIYLQPLLAATLSALWLGERPGLDVIAGGLLIFGGVYLSLWPERPRA
jgi:drug/metabolite transporter (DMT)-like permease